MNVFTTLPRHHNLAQFCLLAVILVAPSTATAEVPPAHNQARCSSCHSGGTAPAQNAALVSAECNSCHRRADPTLAATSFHDNSQGRCLQCHLFHQPDQIMLPTGSTKQLTNVDQNSAICRSCHDSRGDLTSLSPAHREAALLYHTEAAQLQNISPSQTCLNCHSNQSASPWQNQTDGAVIAFNEHASHPYSVRVVPGQGDSSNRIAEIIDPRLSLFDGRMECQTCHLLTAANDDLMIPFPTNYDLCKGCHRHADDQQSQPVLARLTN